MYLEQKAGEVAGLLKTDVPQMDLASIILIIKLIIQAYECFQTHPFSALSAIKNPSVTQRLYLRFLVLRHLGLRNSGPITSALLDTARFVTYDELVGMVEETSGNTA